MSEKGQEHILIIPDYKISIVTSFLEMIYTGNTWLESDSDISEMKEFGFKLLGFFMGLNMNVKIEVRGTSVEPSKKRTAKVLATKSEIFNDSTSASFEDLQNGTFSEIADSLFGNPRKRFKPKLSQAWSCSKNSWTSISSNESAVSDLELSTELTHSQIRDHDIDSLVKSSIETRMEDTIMEDTPKITLQRGRNEPETIEEPNKNVKSVCMECKICHKQLPSIIEFKRHNFSIHNDRYPFCCNVCSKKFTTLGHLNTHHKVTHLNELDWICQSCGKKFGYSSKLKRHLKSCSDAKKAKTSQQSN